MLFDPADRTDAAGEGSDAGRVCPERVVGDHRHGLPLGGGGWFGSRGREGRRHRRPVHQFDLAVAGHRDLPTAGGTVPGRRDDVADTHGGPALELPGHQFRRPVHRVGLGGVGDVERGAPRREHDVVVDLDVEEAGCRVHGGDQVLVGGFGGERVHHPVGHPGGPERRPQQCGHPPADLHRRALREVDGVDLGVAAVDVADRFGLVDDGRDQRCSLG
ncbi:hypothetical protein RHA1_ro05566 [Rhodococcus jostii RHA1]|uniref:Uncharacterized protein n=1 Tax=Rhodococcus jostii (strain RHA1) TaxID=101510 RepID=Q0S540_RHOJR|nr:hypothetical protein RHA1_ro05566 [Rhodococcus jostii RHA1]